MNARATDFTAGDTIAAIATAPGRGGIGVVRASGPGVLELAKRLFRPSTPLPQGPVARFMHHGRLLDEHGVELDEVLCVYMPGPRSFTGEDVLELHCHGSAAVLGAALDAACAAGARPAGPGEFTYRAFVNGRLDLSQAEAVCEMIDAPGRGAAEMAMTRLSGALSARIRELAEELRGLRGELCLAVDFPEEDVECLPRQRFLNRVEAIAQRVRVLLEAFNRSRPWREGASVVLAGRVNAGKSSLMNALLGAERAIVTELPGTTRDYLEERVELDGLAVRLIDTAGLRDTGDAIELEGVRRSRELLGNADLVLLVVDASAGPASEDEELLAQLGPSRCLVAANKTDKPRAEPDPVAALAGLGARVVEVSAATGRGLDELARAVRDAATAGALSPEDGRLVPNARQSRALAEAHEELGALGADIEAGLPFDLLGVRLETACDLLGGITGEIVPDDVLNDIFASFCIGK